MAVCTLCARNCVHTSFFSSSIWLLVDNNNKKRKCSQDSPCHSFHQCFFYCFWFILFTLTLKNVSSHCRWFRLAAAHHSYVQLHLFFSNCISFFHSFMPLFLAFIVWNLLLFLRDTQNLNRQTLKKNRIEINDGNKKVSKNLYLFECIWRWVHGSSVTS